MVSWLQFIIGCRGERGFQHREEKGRARGRPAHCQSFSSLPSPQYNLEPVEIHMDLSVGGLFDFLQSAHAGFLSYIFQKFEENQGFHVSAIGYES